MTARDLFGAVAALPMRRTRFTLRTFRVTLDPPAGVSEERPGPVLTTAAAYGVLRAIYATLDAHTEAFVVLAVDVQRRPVGFKVVSTGTQTGSLVHPREVFTAALALNAYAVILAHNHPSGDPEPSGDDQEITRRLCAVGEVVGIRVVDHVVMGDGCYVSFRDRGWINQ